MDLSAAQELEDQYFGCIPERVLACMAEAELFKLAPHYLHPPFGEECLSRSPRASRSVLLAWRQPRPEPGFPRLGTGPTSEHPRKGSLPTAPTLTPTAESLMRPAASTCKQDHVSIPRHSLSRQRLLKSGHGTGYRGAV
jgi:hypothetical protein